MALARQPLAPSQANPIEHHAPSLEKEPRHDCVSCLIHSLPVTTTFAPLHPPPLLESRGPVQSSSTCRNLSSSITLTRPLPPAALSCSLSFSAASTVCTWTDRGGRGRCRGRESHIKPFPSVGTANFLPFCCSISLPVPSVCGEKSIGDSIGR
ncbi:hypothetical protein J3F84DRAFT_278582 [Trichoderma pleuroticola]